MEKRFRSLTRDPALLALNRTLLFTLWLFGFVLLLPFGALTQRPSPFAGVSIGGGALPVAFSEVCTFTARYDERAGAAAATLRAGIAFGPVVLESRFTVADPREQIDLDCPVLDPYIPTNGIQTTRQLGIRAGNVVGTDLRVRYKGATRFP